MTRPRTTFSTWTPCGDPLYTLDNVPPSFTLQREQNAHSEEVQQCGGKYTVYGKYIQNTVCSCFLYFSQPPPPPPSPVATRLPLQLTLHFIGYNLKFRKQVHPDTFVPHDRVTVSFSHPRYSPRRDVCQSEELGKIRGDFRKTTRFSS